MSKQKTCNGVHFLSWYFDYLCIPYFIRGIFIIAIESTRKYRWQLNVANFGVQFNNANMNSIIALVHDTSTSRSGMDS